MASRDYGGTGRGESWRGRESSIFSDDDDRFERGSGRWSSDHGRDRGGGDLRGRPLFAYELTREQGVSGEIGTCGRTRASGERRETTTRRVRREAEARRDCPGIVTDAAFDGQAAKPPVD